MSGAVCRRCTENCGTRGDVDVDQTGWHPCPPSDHSLLKGIPGTYTRASTHDVVQDKANGLGRSSSMVHRQQGDDGMN